MTRSSAVVNVLLFSAAAAVDAFAQSYEAANRDRRMTVTLCQALALGPAVGAAGRVGYCSSVCFTQRVRKGTTSEKSFHLPWLWYAVSSVPYTKTPCFELRAAQTSPSLSTSSPPVHVLRPARLPCCRRPSSSQSDTSRLQRGRCLPPVKGDECARLLSDTWMSRAASLARPPHRGRLRSTHAASHTDKRRVRNTRRR